MARVEHGHSRLPLFLLLFSCFHRPVSLQGRGRGDGNTKIMIKTVASDCEHGSDFAVTNTPHTSPLRASDGMSFVRILEKIDYVITALHCLGNPWFMLIFFSWNNPWRPLRFPLLLWWPMVQWMHTSWQQGWCVVLIRGNTGGRFGAVGLLLSSL